MSAKIFLLVIATSLAVVSPMAATAAEAVTVSPGVAQVVKMHAQGVAPDVLLAYVRETPITKPTADEVLYLTENGIPKEVIVAMLSKKVWTDAPAPQSQPGPAQAPTQLPPAVSSAQPVTQTVQQAPSTVTYVAPAPVYAAPYYYSPYYYNPWPAFSIGLGLGYGWGHWGHSHWGGHHGGGIHVHHR